MMRTMTKTVITTVIWRVVLNKMISIMMKMNHSIRVVLNLEGHLFIVKFLNSILIRTTALIVHRNLLIFILKGGIALKRTVIITHS